MTVEGPSVGLSVETPSRQGDPHDPHRNARLTQFGGLLLVQRIIELGWPPAQGRAGRPQLRPPRCLHALPASRSAGAGHPPMPPPGPAPAGLAAAHVPLHDLWAAPPSHEPACPHRPDQRRADSAGVGRRVTGGRVGADRQLAAPSARVRPNGPAPGPSRRSRSNS